MCIDGRTQNLANVITGPTTFDLCPCFRLNLLNRHVSSYRDSHCKHRVLFCTLSNPAVNDVGGDSLQQLHRIRTWCCLTCS
jgi:hypothetical protein